MTNKSMKPIHISLLVVMASFAISYYHAMYTGDTVANVLGYFFSMTILPIFIGGAVGCIGIYALRDRIMENLKEYWWLPTSGALASLAPTIIYIIGMSLPHH